MHVCFLFSLNNLNLCKKDVVCKISYFFLLGIIKVKATVEKELENGTTTVELVKRDVLSEVDPNQSEKMKMATMEVDVEKDSTYGVKYVESVKKEVVTTLNNKSEKGAVDTAPVMTDLKNVNDEPASAPPSAQDVKEVIDEPAPDAKEVIANAPVINDEKQVIDAPAKIKNEKASSIELDPNELLKIESESIYAKEDPEAGAEAGKQRVREVFHMDVAELIIERDA